MSANFPISNDVMLYCAICQYRCISDHHQDIVRWVSVSIAGMGLAESNWPGQVPIRVSACMMSVSGVAAAAMLAEGGIGLKSVVAGLAAVGRPRKIIGV